MPSFFNPQQVHMNIPLGAIGTLGDLGLAFEKIAKRKQDQINLENAQALEKQKLDNLADYQAGQLNMQAHNADLNAKNIDNNFLLGEKRLAQQEDANKQNMQFKWAGFKETQRSNRVAEDLKKANTELYGRQVDSQIKSQENRKTQFVYEVNQEALTNSTAQEQNLLTQRNAYVGVNTPQSLEALASIDKQLAIVRANKQQAIDNLSKINMPTVAQIKKASDNKGKVQFNFSHSFRNVEKLQPFNKVIDLIDMAFGNGRNAIKAYGQLDFITNPLSSKWGSLAGGQADIMSDFVLSLKALSKKDFAGTGYIRAKDQEELSRNYPNVNDFWAEKGALNKILPKINTALGAMIYFADNLPKGTNLENTLRQRITEAQFTMQNYLREHTDIKNLGIYTNFGYDNPDIKNSFESFNSNASPQPQTKELNGIIYEQDPNTGKWYPK